MMKKLICFVFCIWIWSISGVAVAEPREIFKLEIPGKTGEYAVAVRPDGQRYRLGRVLRVPSKVKYPAYTASAWAESGTVAATAVNAVHVCVSVSNGRGGIISLLPSSTIAPAAGSSSAFIIDAEAGHAIWGGWAPLVGDSVRVRRSDGTYRVLSRQRLVAADETLVIKVTEDDDMPYMVEFENRVGGNVTAFYPYSRKVIAVVKHKVEGSGRFGGSKYQRTGALRANHCGVLCISTSGFGHIGGFQIIPYRHSYSPEMKHCWGKTQWMIVQSTDGSPLTGRSPLFRGLFVPGCAPLEKLWDFWSTYGRRSTVLCRVDNGPWRRFEEVTGKKDYALGNITHIRIRAPFTSEPVLF